MEKHAADTDELAGYFEVAMLRASSPSLGSVVQNSKLLGVEFCQLDYGPPSSFEF